MYIQNLAALAHVPALGSAKKFLLTCRFMDVAAIKVSRLIALDKFTHRGAAEVLTLRGAIQLAVFWRSMADENQRIDSCELIQPCGQFLLAIFARRVEGCRIRVAHPG